MSSLPSYQTTLYNVYYYSITKIPALNMYTYGVWIDYKNKIDMWISIGKRTVLYESGHKKRKLYDAVINLQHIQTHVNLELRKAYYW